MIPSRCFSCGKVLANKHEKFLKYQNKEQAFKDLGITRYCCKTILLSNIDTQELLSGYEEFPDSIILKTESALSIHNAR